MNRNRIALLIVALVVFVVIDQFTKHLATKMLAGRPALSFMGDMIRLQYSQNPGAFLSLGAALPSYARFWVFVVGPVLALVVVAGFLATSRNAAAETWVTLAIIAAGGASNLLDRLVYEGMVTDFLNVGIGGLRMGLQCCRYGHHVRSTMARVEKSV